MYEKNDQTYSHTYIGMLDTVVMLCARPGWNDITYGWINESRRRGTARLRAECSMPLASQCWQHINETSLNGWLWSAVHHPSVELALIKSSVGCNGSARAVTDDRSLVISTSWWPLARSQTLTYRVRDCLVWCE